MDRNPTVFVSYSWDNEKHQEWVKRLVATLRDNGINATMDVIETQQGTTNLNHMMVQNIRNSDYTVVVMTENYARKADKLQGGVGLETTFLYNYLLEDTKKIIPIIRSGGSSSIPFYLQALHYINFSDDSKIGDSFEELLYRILGKNKIEMPEVGNIPKLGTKKVQPFNLVSGTINNIDESLIPDFSKVIEPTDLDKNRFIKNSYNEIKAKLWEMLILTKNKNNIFDYEFDEITQQKSIIRIYLNGANKYSLKIWVSSSFGGRDLSINMAYGNHISDSDNSMNEIIRCNVDKNNELFLDMTMNYYNRNDHMTSDEVFAVIWRNILDNIKPYKNSESINTISTTSEQINTVNKEVVVYTEEEHLNKSSEDIVEL